jgi:hypothetical protein
MDLQTFLLNLGTDLAILLHPLSKLEGLRAAPVSLLYAALDLNMLYNTCAHKQRLRLLKYRLSFLVVSAAVFTCFALSSAAVQPWY